MKFQIFEGWAIADRFIPAGTMFPNENADWNNLARGRVPPLHSLAIDQEAYDLMYQHYGSSLTPGLMHLVQVGEGVKRK
jgi:hypothetical protein